MFNTLFVAINIHLFIYLFISSVLKCSYKLRFCLVTGFHALSSLGLTGIEAKGSLWNVVLFARQEANYKSTNKARGPPGGPAGNVKDFNNAIFICQVVEVKKYYLASRSEGFIWVITFLATLLLDVDLGRYLDYNFLPGHPAPGCGLR
jgi:hypothetical protein